MQVPYIFPYMKFKLPHPQFDFLGFIAFLESLGILHFPDKKEPAKFEKNSWFSVTSLSKQFFLHKFLQSFSAVPLLHEVHGKNLTPCPVSHTCSFLTAFPDPLHMAHTKEIACLEAKRSMIQGGVMRLPGLGNYAHYTGESGKMKRNERETRGNSENTAKH